MEISNINLVYFSPTFSTRKIVRVVAENIGRTIKEYDITQKTPPKDIISTNGELLVVGIPVYAGRVPVNALEGINRFKSKGGAPAVIVCVYGNRDYDDALLELKDIVECNGFRVVSAGAFIAQHSIFPAVGENRPDEKDIAAIKEFGNKSSELLKAVTNVADLPEIKVKGNNPYKVPRKIPLHPRSSRKCNKCGSCAKLCPVMAIPEDNPRRTDGRKCIACGRCIVICPQKARSFGGLLYRIAGKKFVKANLARKEPETVFV